MIWLRGKSDSSHRAPCARRGTSSAATRAGAARMRLVTARPGDDREARHTTRIPIMGIDVGGVATISEPSRPLRIAMVRGCRASSPGRDAARDFRSLPLADRRRYQPGSVAPMLARSTPVFRCRDGARRSAGKARSSRTRGCGMTQRASYYQPPNLECASRPEPQPIEPGDRRCFSGKSGLVKRRPTGARRRARSTRCPHRRPVSRVRRLCIACRSRQR